MGQSAICCEATEANTIVILSTRFHRFVLFSNSTTIIFTSVIIDFQNYGLREKFTQLSLKSLKPTIRVLLSNAVRYTEAGSISLIASFEPEGLKITVRDTGIGISSEEVSRIFDEFYRVDNSPSRRQGGLGLGLSIVEHSIRHLNARLDVQSEPGRGSSFTLLMPAAT